MRLTWKAVTPMAKAIIPSQFPPLTWDGLYWRGPIAVPWYATAEPTELIVCPDYSRSCEPTDAPSAPQPTSTQLAAFQLLLDPQTPLRQSVLLLFTTHVPELAGPDWASLEAFFELADVRIFHTSYEEVSYVGLVFNCLQWDYGYEHGVGIVAHKDRIAHFGVAEEATHESQAIKDLRRTRRKPGGHNSVRIRPS